MSFLKRHPIGPRRAFAVAVTVLLALQAASAPPCRAGEGLRMMEQNIKAGLLYNFLKYTEWPADPPTPASSPATVCIFGADPFHGSLQPVAERTVNQRQITLRSVDAVEDAAGCNLLFVNADESGRWQQLSTFLAGKSVLTVSDMPDFARLGGMIEFAQRSERIEVQINMEAVSAARLLVNERLLKLAHVVRADRR